MTLKTVIGGLNKESIRAIAHLINLVGAPIIISIGGIAINQLDVIIENQDKIFATQEEHRRALQMDSINITRLFRNDQLLTVKQDATVTSLKINSIVGFEFDTDYEKRYEELFRENRFLNP